MTISTLLSLSRISAALLIALTYFIGPLWDVIFILFLYAGMTDFLDGYLARRFNQCTAFGAWLDHVSDKIVVTTTLLVLVIDMSDLWLQLSTVLLINREIVALGIRSWPQRTSSTSQGLKVHALGKAKTLLQFCSLGLLIASQAFTGTALTPKLHDLGILGLLLATLFAYLSLGVYFRALMQIPTQASNL